MADYQSLARAFRPQVFEDVCEQDVVITTLKNAITMGRVSHAYLFCGSRGVGKTTLARIFAKILNCSNRTASLEPCNSCSSCKEITTGHSLDVLEIDGASNRGIDDIRQLNETVLYTPSAAYKIYIIDEVHMLTKEAFNALLKTLEEPPKHVIFLFATTEVHKVLPTIISRCQRFDLSKLSINGISKKLKKILDSLSLSIEEPALLALAKSADGSLRDAESLLDQVICSNTKEITLKEVAGLLGLPPKEAFFTLDAAFKNNDLAAAFSLAETLYSEGKDLCHFLENLLEHYQTILKILFKVPYQSYDQKEYLEVSTYYTKEQCLYISEYLMQWLEKFYKVSSCKQLHLELILLHIIRSKHLLSLDAIVSQLEAMQSRPAIATKIVDEKVVPVEVSPIEIKKEIETLEAPVEEVANENFNITKEARELHETLMRFASIELNGVLKKED